MPPKRGPGGLKPPPLPKLNKNIKPKVNENQNTKNAVKPKQKPVLKNMTLIEEIHQGVPLKKVETNDQSGIDYLKKNSITKKTEPTNQFSEKPIPVQKIEPKTQGNFFEEMKKIQSKILKKNLDESENIV